MKTLTWSIGYVARCTNALSGTIPAAVAGVAAALLLEHVVRHGLFGLAGDQLPAAVAGGSAWLVAAVGLSSGRPGRMLAHAGFAAILFAGAVAAAPSPAGSVAPWFLALATWIVLHRGDVGHPLAAAGWAAFNAAVAVALIL